MPGHVIAIVDDDNNFLELLRGMLDTTDYTLQTFHRPESAYDAVRSNPPGALIIRIQFPNCQPGIDLATALKLRADTRALPIILTSTDTARLRPHVDHLRGSSVSALWILPQPIDMSVLLPLLTQAIDQLEREVP